MKVCTNLLVKKADRPKSLAHSSASTPERHNPCYSCGACCQHFRISFYSGELAGETGGWVPVELVTQIGPLRACMKGTETGGQRCIGLRGEVGQPNSGCGIYKVRPSVCREYEAYDAHGMPNPDCQRLRSNIGLPPLSPLPDQDLAA